LTDDIRNRVLIAGGGIGGLTCALALARRQLDVHVFEQAATFGEIGAGIQLSPNCVRVLHELGLEARLRPIAFLPEGTQMRDWKTGRMISTTALGAAAVATYGFPYYHVHRADLMDALVAHAREQPNLHLHPGSRFEGLVQTERDVEIRIVRHNDQQRYTGALLVGADGIHSATRTRLFGEQAPQFTGNVAWRALIPVERLPKGLVNPVATVWMGPGKHFVHYYVRAGTLVNCVCVIEKSGWEVESWTQRGDRSELASDFAGWHDTVRVLIDNMDPDACYKWALFDRPPMPKWSDGRVTLLGDACHPTLPFMAQGAAMAIEDAAVLAACVGDTNDVAQALHRYESLRRSRTSRIQLGSRGNAKLFHLRPPYSWLRNRALGKARSNVMDWVFRYDALNATRR
jgi:salicylate hydroxylase